MAEELEPWNGKIKVGIEMVVRLHEEGDRVARGKEGGRGPVFPLHSCERSCESLSRA